jgi:hypothetical protein
MIDLNSDKSFNSDNYIPCPFCAELRAISEAIKGYRTYTGEPILTTIGLLLAEVNMRQTKEEYENRLKSTLLANIKSEIIKNIQDDGPKMDS